MRSHSSALSFWTSARFSRFSELTLPIIDRSVISALRQMAFSFQLRALFYVLGIKNKENALNKDHLIFQCVRVKKIRRKKIGFEGNEVFAGIITLYEPLEWATLPGNGSSLGLLLQFED